MKKPLTETPLADLHARALKLDQDATTELGKRKQAQKSAQYFALLKEGAKPVLGTSS